jgi:site-specific DNA-cytosine methylase
MKHATIIPLIGGMTLANKKITGKDPEVILSYSPFGANDSHINKYLPKVPYKILDDMGEDEKNKLIESLKGKLDFVSTVCPCAGLAGTNTAPKTSSKGRGAHAEQNQWMYKSAKLILEDIKPKVFWGENAPGLFTNMGKEVADNLRKIGEDAGYSFSMIKTNTELHGIPQRRIRTFYFFWNSSTPPIFNWVKRDTPKLLDYLNEIPKDASQFDMRIWMDPVTKKYPPYRFLLEKLDISHEEMVKKVGKGTVFRYMQDNNLFDECLEWLKVHAPNDGPSGGKPGTNTYIDIINHIKNKLADGKGYWDSSPHLFHESFNAVIGRNMFDGVHPIENRYMSVREYIHMMGMPHDFELDNIKNINHIAQNVPVTTASDMTQHVVDFINGKLTPSDGKFLKQDNVTRKTEVITNQKQLELSL